MGTPFPGPANLADPLLHEAQVATATFVVCAASASARYGPRDILGGDLCSLDIRARRRSAQSSEVTCGTVTRTDAPLEDVAGSCRSPDATCSTDVVLASCSEMMLASGVRECPEGCDDGRTPRRMESAPQLVRPHEKTCFAGCEPASQRWDA